MFVSAAAGSGKTRVLTERFVRLVGDRAAAGGEEPLSSVAAVTFTEKAAGEIAERIRGTFARSGDIASSRRIDEAWIGTIHGLCARILRRHAFEAGLDPMFSLADDVESGILRHEAFEAVLREAIDDEAVMRLVVDYDVAEIEQCAHDVDAQFRSLNAAVSMLSAEGTDVARTLGDLLPKLEESLGCMRGLEGRKATEEKNIEALSTLVEALAAITVATEDVALRVLEALDGFKQSKGCRECAKPLAANAEETAERLRQAAVDAVSTGYAKAFLRLLERYGARYDTMKDARGLLDFEDLQVKTRNLLEDRPDLERAYRERFAEVMVDEFQDTNALQVSVIEALAGRALASVGDEKQSIYGWRNADVEVFRRRQAELEPARRFELPENYRSHPDLVSFFNGIFGEEPFWPDSFMRLEAVAPPALAQPAAAPTAATCASAWPDARPRVSVRLLSPESRAEGGAHVTEARAVAEHFADIAATGIPQGDMVLLLRSMTHVDAFEAALRSVGFDVFVGSGGTYFDTPEAEELTALLRSIANSADDEAFARLLAGRMVALSDDSLLLLREAAQNRRTLWEAASDPKRPPLPGDDETAVARVVSVLEWARGRQGALPLYDLVHDACERLDYDVTLFASGQPRAWANVLKFARLAEQFEEASAGDPSAFLDYLELRRTHKRYEQQAATSAEGVDAVRIMTVHGAKGLEFPVVAVAGLGSRLRNDTALFDAGMLDGAPVLGTRLPGIEPFGKDARDTVAYRMLRDRRRERELDEAKRVLYVACTRASQALSLFGVTDPDKEPDPNIPVGWLRTALSGLGTPGDPTSSPDGERTLLEVGGARVELRIVRVATEDDATSEAGVAATQAPLAEVAGRTRPDALGCAVPPTLSAATAPASSTRPPRRISFTGLNLFATCGLRYYATYVARLGTRVDSGEALRVGSAVHAVLRLCGRGTRPTAERIAAISRYEGVSASDVGRVAEAVRAFVDSEVARRAFAAPAVLHEVPFGVLIGDTVLDGSIDLLARDGNHALVVDYKTGRSEPDADTLEHWRLQSECYAVAALRSGAARAEVVFVQPENGGLTRTYEYEAADLAGIEAGIGDTIASIAEGMFEPRAVYDHASCAECPARGVLCVPKKAPGPAGAA